ncbi:MAG: aspartyl-tRNA(Asn)/glutamyl-tRNA (Gln) amidotransferase subunit A [Parcubacteria group bacterium Gr01-1014_66]|nr:MAG: aspartyl-tRNA(Asn)/glutamyl-tRNA (Gln) amidotransferase subunit A [Parcubacteria group bacterium Gr01-1014_66]
MNPFNTLTITEAAKALAAKEFSARELLDSCLDAIAKEDPAIGAYLEIFSDARAHADAVDQARIRNQNPLPTLAGIPLAIKDNILIEEKHCSAGSRMLEHYVAPYSASVITRLHQQHAVCIGRTNMDEFAMGSSTEYSAFHITKNPHDLARVPGGSSGGSAAAVASHMCLGALGSDTGGSIRQPASFCGVVGFKPSYGMVSRYGLIPMASSLDQIGPLTKTVADARIIFDAIKSKDEYDATLLPVTPPRQTPIRMPKDILCGVPKEYFGEGLDSDVAILIHNRINLLEKNGVRITEVAMPRTPYALACYYIIVPSEISANLARFDTIRYGTRDPDAHTLHDLYANGRGRGFGPEVRRRILVGTYALSAGYYDAYYVQAQRARQLIADEFNQVFQQVDFLIGPTTPMPAFHIGEKTNDPLSLYLGDVYTVGANLAGIPALSLPAGFAMREEKKLPVGLQLMGKRFHDTSLLDAAEIIERIFQNQPEKAS